mmetsp:Transcript_17221/g.51507  ORF Transcript_17221/g.51507 Transcript_17221/m.51507 type:complete len:883 (-) Transcript_17221:2276-4924(-)
MGAEGDTAPGSMLLPIAGLVAVIAMIVAPSAFLVLAVVLAVVGGGAALIRKPPSDQGTPVQLQEMPSSTSSAKKGANFTAAHGDGESRTHEVNGGSHVQEAASPVQSAGDCDSVTTAKTADTNGDSASSPLTSGTFTHAADDAAGSVLPAAAQTSQPTASAQPAARLSKAPDSSRDRSAIEDFTPASAKADVKPQRPAVAAQAPVAAPAVAGKAAAGGGAAILARLKAQRAKAAEDSKAAAAAPEVVVLYASQTGTAQEVARTIQASSAEHKIKSKVMSCNELGWENLSSERTPIVIIVASSTGDGDSPDNAAKFYATMKRKTQPLGQLKGISVAVLGLGDSNYTRFCHVPKTFRNRMTTLGATPFYQALDADEVDGLEALVDAWVDGLWEPLKRQVALLNGAQEASGEAATAAAPGAEVAAAGPAKLEGVPPLPPCRVCLVWHTDEARRAAVAAAEAARPTEEQVAVRDEEGVYSAEAPFWAPVREASVITAADSDRRVLHMGLDVTGSGMQYQPGDSVGVVVQNQDDLVDALLKRLGADGGAVLSVEAADGSEGGRLLPHLNWPCTLRHAFKAGCDITGVPRKSLLRVLAEHCTDTDQQHSLLLLCSRGGRDAYTTQVREGQPSLVDLLAKFPSCHPPLDALLDALPALAPRLYSVASSPLAQPHQVDVAFSVVRVATPHGTRRGVATTWLDAATSPPPASGDAPVVRLPVFLRSGGAFRPPSDLSRPVILIGPGTGVAPFRGFLQHRREQLRDYSGTVGEAWLFFGCRRREEDALYLKDWEEFAADGTLAHLHIAYSRAQAEKVYVQHLVAREGAAVHAALADGSGSVFVCGDGADMAKAVHAALADVFTTHGGLTASEASARLTTLANEQRYVRDVWS